jgi:hypothetical protein
MILWERGRSGFVGAVVDGDAWLEQVGGGGGRNW